jgi:hypothetical protein
MQTVVVPHNVDSFQVVCEECLAGAGKDGAVARLVTGMLEPGARITIAACPVGHRVEALRLEEGLSAAALIGHAA